MSTKNIEQHEKIVYNITHMIEVLTCMRTEFNNILNSNKKMKSIFDAFEKCEIIPDSETSNEISESEISEPVPVEKVKRTYKKKNDRKSN